MLLGRLVRAFNEAAAGGRAIEEAHYLGSLVHNLGARLPIARAVAERHGFGYQSRRSEAGGLEVEIAGEVT